MEIGISEYHPYKIKPSNHSKKKSVIPEAINTIQFLPIKNPKTDSSADNMEPTGMSSWVAGEVFFGADL